MVKSIGLTSGDDWWKITMESFKLWYKHQNRYIGSVLGAKHDTNWTQTAPPTEKGQIQDGVQDGRPKIKSLFSMDKTI